MPASPLISFRYQRQSIEAGEINKQVQRRNRGILLGGAVPAALMAIIIEAGFGLAERWLVPRGLRLAATK